MPNKPQQSLPLVAGTSETLRLFVYLCAGRLASQMTLSEVEKAVAATEAFVSVLQAEDLQGWVKRFAHIAAYLEVSDVKGALHSYRNTSYAGSGSLSDIYAQDQAAFDRAWSQCSVALRAPRKA